jgi:saccharopine dehydrogenase-like NADP-dependent oxidoreductase
MKRILVLGAGKIGIAAATMLRDTLDYSVALADFAPPPPEPGGLARFQLDVTDGRALRQALQACDVVVSTLPFYLCLDVAKAAHEVGVHYVDPTEDVKTARAIRALAEGAGTAFIPQCGLAPGFVAIVAHHLASAFDSPHDVKLRVGALPQFPDNALKYNLTWSTDGLINEYCNPCEVVQDGARTTTAPLDAVERFSFDGAEYEAFATSGGVGSLVETLAGEVRNLSYKTIRYPGHRDMVKMLVDDLHLCRQRDVFKKLIEGGIPTTKQDVVIVFVTVRGMKDGAFTQDSYAKKIYGGQGDGRWSAIQLTTASALAAVVDLLATGALPDKGFVKQEQIAFPSFIANRFGRVYA